MFADRGELVGRRSAPHHPVGARTEVARRRRMPHARPCRARLGAGGVALCCLAALTAASVRPARAQVPDLPAAQSAFPAPGLAVALDGGRTSGRGVGSLAGATGVRRLQLTAAVGLPGAPAGFERSGVSAGARLAARLYRTPRLGVAAFAGYGAERLRQDLRQNADSFALGEAGASPRPKGAFVQVPVGVSAGYRGLFGARPYALSVAPMFAYSRWKISDTSRTRSGARVAALAELAVTPKIGVGVAVESGAGGPAGSPFAARRTVIGAGVSYALRRVVAR